MFAEIADVTWVKSESACCSISLFAELALLTPNVKSTVVDCIIRRLARLTSPIDVTVSFRSVWSSDTLDEIVSHSTVSTVVATALNSSCDGGGLKPDRYSEA